MTYIIGAGLSGLSAALELAQAGQGVSVYEAAPHAGGRCRSYYDTQLDCETDNGNHLLLACNANTLELIDKIGAKACWKMHDTPYHFYDVEHARHWQWAAPSWLPALPIVEYWRIALLPFSKTVAGAMPSVSNLAKRWATPLCVSALNTQPYEAQGRQFLALLWNVLRSGKDAGHPVTALKPFNEALIDPLVEHVKSKGVSLYFQKRLQRMDSEDGRITQLHFAGESKQLQTDDRVIVALPPREVSRLLPQLALPESVEAIMNVHYRYRHGRENGTFVGLSGSHADWVFFKGEDVVSTTTSAANHLAGEDKDVLAQEIWRDIAQICDYDATTPVYRALNEKQATIKATAQNAKKRPASVTQHSNLFLAGDYTKTGLPCTIEGAVVSGVNAAKHCLAS